jgi:hypothetical protein
MTSSPTPDISSLSLSQQHLNDNYDYDPLPSGNTRPQHYFQTSPPIPAQSQYNPLGLNHSPVKSKPTRSAIPTVSQNSSDPHDAFTFLPLAPSNGLKIQQRSQKTVHCLHLTTLPTSLLQVVLLLSLTSILLLYQPHLQSTSTPTTLMMR